MPLVECSEQKKKIGASSQQPRRKVDISPPGIYITARAFAIPSSMAISKTKKQQKSNSSTRSRRGACSREQTYRERSDHHPQREIEKDGKEELMGKIGVEQGSVQTKTERERGSTFQEPPNTHTHIPSPLSLRSSGEVPHRSVA